MRVETRASPGIREKGTTRRKMRQTRKASGVVAPGQTATPAGCRMMVRKTIPSVPYYGTTRGI